MPVCAWVDGEYGLEGVYLGVQAEIGGGPASGGRGGGRPHRVGELARAREAAEAVRAKQADIASM